MNKIFIVICASLLFLSCKKDTQKPSKTSLLTSKEWIYFEYYINYNDSNTVLAYKQNKPSNLYDLSKSRLKYNADGSYEETKNNGAKTLGTWKFIDNESKIEVQTNQSTFDIAIYVLNESFFEWASADGNTIGMMAHQ